MTDPEVKNLQVFLNTHGFTLAKNGAGSPGKETNKYGLLTYKAVVKFQKKYGLKDDGVVGPKTRAVINGMR
jgi:peptidoglycan hydrolase-like protein with peptidoglycan-binding domain